MDQTRVKRGRGEIRRLLPETIHVTADPLKYTEELGACSRVMSEMKDALNAVFTDIRRTKSMPDAETLEILVWNWRIILSWLQEMLPPHPFGEIHPLTRQGVAQEASGLARMLEGVRAGDEKEMTEGWADYNIASNFFKEANEKFAYLNEHWLRESPWGGRWRRH